MRIGWRQRREVAASIASSPPPPRTDRNDQPVVVPSLTAHVDLAEWNERAKALGGNSASLLAGFAGRLGVRMGRVRSDGSVTISLPISDRTENDTRGNALMFLAVSVDPTHLSSDLREIRTKIRQGLADLPETSAEMLEPLPLTSFTPKWAARGAAGIGLGTANIPIGCSNLGDLHPQSNRVDGTDADYMQLRFFEPGMSQRTLERIGGQLLVVSVRVHGKIYISVNAYRNGQANSQDTLRKDLSRTFAEFNLTAEIQD
jgi:hypothetical protein